MKMLRSRGFTLIELLLVIAIIGVLSMIVLASLGTARSKAYDRAVQSDLRTVHVQAALFQSNNIGRYNTDGATAVAASNTVCPTSGNTMFAADPIIKAAIAAANAASGGSATCYMDTGGTAFVVWSPLRTAGIYWCVDSLGNSQQKIAVQGSATSC